VLTRYLDSGRQKRRNFDVTLYSSNYSNSFIVVYVVISESPETRLVPISIRAINMHKIESREISNRKYLSKTILACRKRQAKNLLAYCVNNEEKLKFDCI